MLNWDKAKAAFPDCKCEHACDCKVLIQAQRDGFMAEGVTCWTCKCGLAFDVYDAFAAHRLICIWVLEDR